MEIISSVFSCDSMNAILSLSIIFLTGWGMSKLIKKLKLPTVTGNLILGIIIGQEVLDLISSEILDASSFISNIVLGIIAFSIGQNFSLQKFREIGKTVLIISLCEAIGAWLIVTFVFSALLKFPFHVAILFGSIASATAPAATVIIIKEYQARGPFSNILIGVVALDDAWCLIIFAFSHALSRSIGAHIIENDFFIKVIIKVIIEIGGALIFGGGCAFVLNYFSKYIKTSGELQIYTFGFILLAVGVALALHISVLLSAMFLGAFVVNIEKHFEEKGFFDALKALEPMFYMLFFILAGANLSISLLKDIGLIGIIYFITRIIGKFAGSYTGAILARAPSTIKKYIGLGLIPQAGVALGVALVVKGEFPEIGKLIFNTIITTTIIYELIGPIFTKIGLQKAGEINLTSDG